MSKSVVVGIPIYKENITELERISLAQVDRILSAYEKVFIAPQSLSFDYGYDYDVVRFSDDFFVSTESYSDLLMNEEFYRRFEAYDYLLIYQLDAFVFSDTLQEICSWGYDYIGAPLKGTDWKIFHVGNGGLSLRNVRKCMEVAEQKQLIIKKLYSVMTPTTLAEDVFFGYCGWAKDINFTVPSPRVAARFSTQNDYAGGMRDIKKRGLPFGCHYWWRLNYDFWKPHIEKIGYSLPSLETTSNLKIDAIGRMMYLIKRYRGDEECFPISSNSFAIYGAGVWGKRCLEFFQKLSMKVKIIYDQDYEKRNINGVIVIKPNKEEILGSNDFIVISTLTYEKEIRKKLLDWGLKEGKNFCTLYELCCCMFTEKIRSKVKGVMNV